MFILLPTDKQGLTSLIRLEEKLTVEKLEHMFSRMEAKTVAISLPKFRIQQKLQLKIRPQLQPPQLLLRQQLLIVS